MRVFRGTVLLVLVMTLLVSCSSGEGEQGGPSEPAPDITLESLGLDWDTSGQLPRVDPPETPAGMTQGVYDALIDTLREWATASTIQPRVWTAEDPLPMVVDAISQQDLARLLVQVLGDTDSFAPRLLAANRIPPDVTVIGDPAVAVRWNVGPVTLSDGAAAVEVMLQTLAAYEVQLDDGTQRVVGMVRNHVFRQKEGDEGKVSVAVRWQEFGADNCALRDEDALRPDADIDLAIKDLDDLVEIADSDRPHDMDEVDGYDIGSDDYAEKCSTDPEG